MQLRSPKGCDVCLQMSACMPFLSSSVPGARQKGSRKKRSRQNPIWGILLPKVVGILLGELPFTYLKKDLLHDLMVVS